MVDMDSSIFDTCEKLTFENYNSLIRILEQANVPREVILEIESAFNSQTIFVAEIAYTLGLHAACHSGKIK